MAKDRDPDEESEKLGFKVQDRRRFTAEGKAIGDDREEEPSAPEQPAQEPDRPRAPRSAAPDPDEQRGRAPEDLTFSSFAIGLASQAFAFLGAMPDPQSGMVRKDLPQAKALIDILSMLAEKTAGNLDEQEGHMMEEMLYELRMLYVKELRGDDPMEDKA